MQNKVKKQYKLGSGEMLNLSSPLNRELLKGIMEGYSFQFELFSLFRLALPKATAFQANRRILWMQAEQLEDPLSTG